MKIKEMEKIIKELKKKNIININVDDITIITSVEIDKSNYIEQYKEVLFKYLEILYLMVQYGVISMDEKTISSIEFKYFNFQDFPDEKILNKNFIKFLKNLKVKEIFKEKMLKFNENFFPFYKDFLNCLCCWSISDFLLSYNYEKFLNELGNILEKEYSLIKINKILLNSQNDFEDNFFKIANKSSCLRYGGCYQFYNENSYLRFFPVLVVNSTGKIIGRGIYEEHNDVFLNFYIENAGSSADDPVKSLLENFYQSSIKIDYIRQGYNQYDCTLYIDFVISENQSKIDDFLNRFPDPVGVCYYCDQEIYDGDEYFYCSDIQDCICENCSDVVVYCDFCQEYHYIYQTQMIYIPSRDIYTCDFQILE